jgi:hypothetical protein
MMENLNAPSDREQEKQNCVICKWKEGSILGFLKQGEAYLVCSDVSVEATVYIHGDRI